METLQRLFWKLIPVLRVILAALFVYAGVAKLTDVLSFAAQVQHFGLENRTLATAFAHYLPFLEVACGLALFTQRARGGAVILCITLLVVFEGGLAYAWHTGYTGGCGCFGKFFGGASIKSAFGRNLILLAVAGALITTRPSTLQGEPT